MPSQKLSLTLPNAIKTKYKKLKIKIKVPLLFIDFTTKNDEK
ncbi:MAG: hypothetical protein NZ891_03870 [bacterium]|nr:hypothetical protein [bacterium]MDW8163863.1 hypothetical protein [Candidatus Omnitrophota bacterium]